MQNLIDFPTDKSIESHLAANSVRPTTALIFHTRNGKLCLTTSHSIGSRGRVPYIQPGKPLSPSEEARMVAMLLNRDDEGDTSRVRINPPNILHSDGASTTWLCPSRVEPMVLRSHKGDTTVLVRWPTLVMHTRNRQLYVVALESDKWPTEDAQVYHSPTANTWASTQVCTGSAVLPLGCTPDNIEAWEAAWFNSAFTHANHNQVITTVEPPKGKGRSKAKQQTDVSRKYADPMEFWSQRDGNLDAFPVQNLTPLPLTLGQWISQRVFAGAGE